jgi:Nucleotidyltransferase of unknown function (DUF6036)
VLETESLESALSALGRVLGSRGLSYELVTFGGSSLMLLGLIQRPTRDLDVIALIASGNYVKASSLPVPLTQAVADVGAIFQLGPDWINAGPADLLDFGLPRGFAERTEVRGYGSLTLRIASRQDQVALKLYAATDQGPQSKHFEDLRALAPTRDELLAGARWAITHDPSGGFRSQLVGALAALEVFDVEPLL